MTWIALGINLGAFVGWLGLALYVRRERRLLEVDVKLVKQTLDEAQAYYLMGDRLCEFTRDLLDEGQNDTRH